MRTPASILARGVALAVSLLAAGSAWAEQHVVLYSANDDTVNKLVADGFAKATGIKLDVVSTGSGVLVRRITSEAANPQGDVIWGVSATILRLASPYLQAYPAKDRDAVPAQFRDPKDLWLGTNIQVVVIGENTKAIDKDSGPKSWADLLDPKLKGKLAFTDPSNSGFSYAAATLLLSQWGEGDAAWTKMSQLLANAKVLNRSTQVFEGVGSGEYPLGITLEYAGFLWAHNGAPVNVVYPAEGTHAVVEGAGHPERRTERRSGQAAHRLSRQQGCAGDVAEGDVPAACASGYRSRRRRTRHAAVLGDQGAALRRCQMGSGAARHSRAAEDDDPGYALIS